MIPGDITYSFQQTRHILIFFILDLFQRLDDAFRRIIVLCPVDDISLFDLILLFLFYVLSQGSSIRGITRKRVGVSLIPVGDFPF